MSRSSRWVAVAAVAGFLFFTLGLFAYSVAPDFFQKKLKQNLVIQEDSQLYESWVEPPVPIYLQFYFFNVDNPDDVADGRLPVRLTQQGPYAFRKLLKKTDVTFDSQGSVSYILRKWYVFEPALTSGFLNDTITIPNIPLMGFGKNSEKVKMTAPIVYLLNQNIRTHKAKMFVRCTIGELLFDGYFDKFINFVSKQRGQEFLPDGKFAFFYKVNGTGQTFLVNTGADNFSSLGAVKSWTNSAINSSEIRDGTHDSLSYWNDTLCDAINGTDGSRFPPPITKDQVLRMFSDELCRSLYVRFDQETEVHGISTLRFTLPEELMENSPENQCFFAGQESVPLGSGMLNVSVCRKDAPVVLSPVHFLNIMHNDTNYTEVYPDLQPTSDSVTFLDIEPQTGMVLRAAKKLQVNIVIRKYKYVRLTNTIPQRLVFPVFWINESVEITPDKAEELRTKLIVLPKVINSTALVLIGAGAVILLLVIECGLVKCCRKTSSRHTKLRPVPPLPAAHFVKIPNKMSSENTFLNTEENEDNEATSGL